MCDVIGVGFVSQNELALRKSARWFLNWLTAEINANHPDLPVRILGPVPSPVYKAAGRYRYRMMIKCRKSKTLYELLSHALTEFLQYKENKEVSVYLDPTYDYAT